MINILDLDKLKDYSKETLDSKYNKQTLLALETIIDLTNKNNLMLVSNDLVMEHQNTTYENYQFIMKDFIADINKSVEIIVNSIIELFKELPEIINSNPIICGHKIAYNKESNTLESITTKEQYCEYMNSVLNKGILASSYLKSIDSSYLETFDRIMGFRKGDDGSILQYSTDTLFENRYQAKLDAIFLDDSHKIEAAIRKSKDLIEPNTFDALNFFVCTKEERKQCINEIYYSINLSDDKIINKGDKIYFLKNEDISFELIGNNVITATKNSTKWTYRFSSNFDISYYIKKELIEIYTQKDMFTFMCIYRDFLSNYVYINFHNKDEFNQEHPSIKEANLIDEINAETRKYEKRLRFYFEKIDEVKESSKDCLIVTKSLKEWLDLLEFPDKTKKYFYSKFSNNNEPTIDEFTNELQLYANKTIENCKTNFLNTEEKKKSYELIQCVNNFLKDSINNLYNKLYYHDNLESINTSFDLTRFFNKREKANFHTTLKDSIIIDCRKETIVSKNISKYINEDNVKQLVSLLDKHKYHDYLELDPEVITSKESITNINEIIFFLDKTNKFDIPVPQKCAIKYRKLGNYKALGIYFSFSKQLGLDYRKGVTSYIHELAHHIDLNTVNHNRKHMVNILYSYFEDEIEHRREYYLKSEELIARAAEISLILLFGRYYQYKEFYDKNEIDSITLIKAIKETFEKSKYKGFMHQYDNYKSIEYIDFEKEIMNCNFVFIENILNYFKAFWGGKELSSRDEKILASNVNVTYNNENNFSKKNEYSYNYYYKGLFKNRISLI